MPLAPAQIPRYPIQALTRFFHIQGFMEPVGPILDYTNDVNRPYLPFLDAVATPLTASPVGKVTRSQIVIPKTDLVALYIDDAAARSKIQLLKRFERCIAYTPSLICRAELHMGSETRWQDALAMLAGDFFGVTSAAVFPLLPLPGPFPQQADLLILNRLHVNMFHMDQP